jgi:hypothetical protein
MINFCLHGSSFVDAIVGGAIAGRVELLGEGGVLVYVLDAELLVEEFQSGSGPSIEIKDKYYGIVKEKRKGASIARDKVE